jgi:single-strand DNA-binding protein
MDLNRAAIIGNATREPELRVTATAQKVCSFSVATNQNWTDQEGKRQQRAEYHNIVAWGKLAEICSQYIGKATKVYVEGRLQTREWETADGQKRSRTEVIADNVILLERKTNEAVQPPQEAKSDQEINLADIPF